MLFSFLFLSAGLSTPPERPIARVEVAPITWTPETLRELAEEKAQKYHLIRPEDFVATMSGESLGFTWNDQSLIITNDGTRELSYGICQIHLPSWPDVSKEEALDPEFCLEWSAKKFSEGKAHLWTVYRNLAK